MSLDVKMRQIELTYEWDPVNSTHILTWDTDYPMNIHGTVVKVFKPYHEFTYNATQKDKIRLVGAEIDSDEFSFVNLNGIPARSNCFVAGQYVPICIDFDDKVIAYFAPRAGASIGETVIEEISAADWVNKQYLVKVSEMSPEMVVVMSPNENATELEITNLVNYGITAKIVPEGIMLHASVTPRTDISIQFTIL